MDIKINTSAYAILETRLGPDQFLRVGVAEGGCAGMTYNAEIDHMMQGDECVVHEEGVIRIVADKTTTKYLDGLVVDYSDDLINGGLQLSNTHTTNTCGCGQSFTLSGFPQVEGGSCHH